MEAWCKKHKVPCPKIDDTNRGCVYPFGSYTFVHVDATGKHWDIVDTIIHESVHVFQRCMQFVEEGRCGDEVEAYHIAEITVNLLKDFHALREVKETTKSLI